MKILNLTNLDTSDIKFKVSKFPDGQQNITINKYWGISIHGFDSMNGPKRILCKPETYNQPVKIKSRLNNFLDLELIICAVASLRELGVEEIHLYVPYIVGARSDRKFEEGGNNYLKDVICPIINSLNFKTVTCIDPHSDVLEACIKGFRKESNFKLVRYALHRMSGEYENISNTKILVSPDAGASKKIYKLAEQIGYKGDIITCSKDRDKNGKLTRTVVPYEFSGKDVIIIDDICDGGATFINIAKTIRDRVHNSVEQPKIYLIVTHSIFSKGTDELLKYFDGIYCTNSYKELILNDSELGFEKGLIKQLNVF